MALIDRVKKASGKRDSDLDFFQTPSYATEILIKYLVERGIKRIWEPACGEGMITKYLKKNGFEVFQSDIKKRKDNIVKFDFLSRTTYPPIRRFSFDAIITNPPYEIKDEFIERCFELKKPFALFVPLFAIGGVKRVDMYLEYGVEFLVPDKRTNFIYPDGGDRNWFHCFWLCHDILPEKLMFVKMRR